MKLGRKHKGSLYAAILAAHGTALEDAARDKLVPMIVRAEARPAGVARLLGVCDRSARRLLKLYGWSRPQPWPLAMKNERASKRAA